MLEINPLIIKRLNGEPKSEIESDSQKFTLPRTSQERLEDALSQPPIKRMFGDLWLSGELHLLFADTGVGKSILAVTIGDALSKGKKVMFLENECEPLTVLYYDFELSDRQFLRRYSNERNECYGFSSYLFTDNIDFKELLKNHDPNDMEKLLFQKLRHDVRELKADALIVDNVTFLKTHTTQRTDSALELMRELTELKKDLNLSILVLAHTPKINLSEPLTINSLAGSKHLSNFADSVSALGRSELGKDIRYIKQIKVRNAEMMYDSSNVITCKLLKDDNFLTFKFIGFNEEREHLKSQSRKEQRNELIEQARQLIEEGNTYTQAAETLLGDPKKKGTIFKWVNGKDVSTVSEVSNSENGNDGNNGNGDDPPY